MIDGFSPPDGAPGAGQEGAAHQHGEHGDHAKTGPEAAAAGATAGEQPKAEAGAQAEKTKWVPKTPRTGAADIAGLRIPKGFGVAKEMAGENFAKEVHWGQKFGRGLGAGASFAVGVKGIGDIRDGHAVKGGAEVLLGGFGTGLSLTAQLAKEAVKEGGIRA